MECSTAQGPGGMIGTRGAWIAMLLAWLALPVAAMAAPLTQADVDDGQQIFTTGLGKQVPPCLKCHGADGLGSDAVFCSHDPRRVARDATISWPGGDLALPRRSDGRSWAGRTVILQERLDGSLWVSHDGLCVPVRPAPADARQLRARRLTTPSDRDLPAELAGLIDADKSPAPGEPGDVVHRPRPDHPWRRYRDRGR